jgi:hypothetical protein
MAGLYAEVLAALKAAAALAMEFYTASLRLWFGMAG